MHELLPSKSKIKELPEFLINQIKAGEVIDSPAHLIKEIIENSLDANAKNLSLEIQDSGLKYIKLEDDGDGMSFEDLKMAFKRHATSKIQQFDDLYQLGSFGFRGEALAAIAGSSKITCSSFSSIQNDGGIISLESGEVLLHQRSKSHSSGTALHIKDLFFNTPVRLKFLKSKISEKKQIKKIINSFIISHPHVSFKIKWDDGDVQFFPALEENNFLQRIYQVFPLLDLKSFFKFNNEYEGYQVNSFIFSGIEKIQNAQFIFINKRLVVDKFIHHSLTNILKQKNLSSLNTPYFIFIEVPKNKIDVNVHPNKTMVRLEQSSIIYSLFTSTFNRTIEKNVTEGSAQSFDLEKKYEQKSGIKSLPQNNQILSYRENIKLSYLFEHSKKFGLLKTEDESYCIDLTSLLKFIFRFHLVNKQNVDENELIPLIIGIPITLKESLDQRMLLAFRNIGIVLEEGPNQSHLIKAYPCWMDVFKNLQSLLVDFVHSWVESNCLNLATFLDGLSSSSTMCQNFLVYDLDIKQVIDEFGFDVILAEKFMAPLRPIIKKLFEENEENSHIIWSNSDWENPNSNPDFKNI